MRRDAELYALPALLTIPVAKAFTFPAKLIFVLASPAQAFAMAPLAIFAFLAISAAEAFAFPAEFRFVLTLPA
jgi:hypothetical protein